MICAFVFVPSPSPSFCLTTEQKKNIRKKFLPSCCYCCYCYYWKLHFQARLYDCHIFDRKEDIYFLLHLPVILMCVLICQAVNSKYFAMHVHSLCCIFLRLEYYTTYASVFIISSLLSTLYKERKFSFINKVFHSLLLTSYIYITIDLIDYLLNVAN